MESKRLIDKQKVEHHLDESQKHFVQMQDGISELSKIIEFPLSAYSYQEILTTPQYRAYSDQIIYRFSKLYDCMHMKLFGSIVQYEQIKNDHPLQESIKELEKLNIITKTQWLQLQKIRDEIDQECEEVEETTMDILNQIFQIRHKLEAIIERANNHVSKLQKSVEI
ncbi:MAG: hypothetical protein U9N49_12315 [Campylobacterota bacterium]|nr:hypothetical protein [Campylobacterota bacterium]